MTKPKDAEGALKLMKDKDVKYVDLRFTDTKGRMQHVTFDIDLVDEEFLEEGTMFDGSSIAFSASSSASTISIFTLGRKSTTYSAPR